MCPFWKNTNLLCGGGGGRRDIDEQHANILMPIDFHSEISSH